ncbi:MAG: MtrB/PioB family decaheme-associated outer membrane protein [Acidobacteria bacterium]|nr:MtrB/PioB family decaheme-associated outer membrane protein [Acidobacteriota bacterium]
MTIEIRPRLIGLAVVIVCGIGLLPGSSWAQSATTTWPARAQANLFGPNPFGNVEVGVRSISGDTASSKFGEYRHIPKGLFLGRLAVLVENADKTAFLELRSREVRERDQNFFVAAGFARTLRVEVEWDQIPHTFSTTGRTILDTSVAGTHTVSPVLRAALAANPASAAALVPATATAQELEIRQDTGRAAVRLTPTESWDVRVQYANEKQAGTRPISTNFGFNSIEQAEPIDYRTHQFTSNVEYARGPSVLQVGYNLSLFRNQVSALSWDNPFILADRVGGPASGRLDLYPNNDAHNVSVTGATKLPWSGRVAATVNTGWMLQNDPFLPFTINAAVAPLAPALPARSLDGRIRTLLGNFAANVQPAKRVSLSARYRFYDLANHTPALIFPAYVSYDTSVGTVARRNVPYAYTRQNAGVDASFQLARGVSAKALFEREVWTREHREARHNADNTYGAAIDVAPNGWLMLHTSYRRSTRRAAEYDAEATAHFGFPFGEPGLGQLDALRKFDQADRNRDRLDGVIQIAPLESLSFDVAYGIANDDFVNSSYGLLFNNSNTASFNVTFAPVPQVALYAELGRELYSYAFQSRYRVPAGATPAVDFTRDDWRRSKRDRKVTRGGGFDAILAERVNLNVAYSRARATGLVNTVALDPAAIATVLAGAVRYPDTMNQLQALTSSVRYRLREDLAAKLEYLFEKYDETDFANDVMQPVMTAVDPSATQNLFLGARQPGYRAHIVVLALQYRFP